MTAPYHVFARRFRPQLFSSVLGQDAIITVMKNALRFGRLAHAYLFSGARGTGKTSMARLFAKAINCTALSAEYEPCNICSSCKEIAEGRSLDFIEIDGASHRGIEDIRAIADSVSYVPTSGKYKIYLLDEVHMLTKEAFNALLKTLEEPPKNVLFFFATTEPHKVLPTIISRCQRFNLKRISSKIIVQKLLMIAETVGLRVEEKAIERIASYAEGGLRDAESMFDQVSSFSQGSIDHNMVQEILGLSPKEWFLKIDRAIESVSYATGFEIVESLFLEGKDVGYFIQDLSTYYTEFLRNPNYHHPRLSAEEIVHILELITKAHVAIKSAASSKIILEWLLTGIIQIRLKMPLSTIVKKFIELDKVMPSVESSSPKDLLLPQIEPVPLKEPLQPQAPIEKRERRGDFPSETESQERARQESIMQFASVELDSALIKKSSRPIP